jgi:DNA modification methylase
MPELTWRGKRLATVEPAELAVDSLVYPNGYGYPHASIGNRLLWGDNLGMMTALLPDYEGRIHLIYADPPFFTNKKFSTRIGRGEDSRKPGEWKLVEGYRDDWDGLDSYLDFLYQRIAVMYRLLAPNGTLYMHLDWHADSYARIILDEIFGAGHLLNEIIWSYHGPSPIKRGFNRKHDTILSFFKGKDYTFNADAVREPYHQNTVNTFKSSRKAGFGKIPNLARGKVPEDWWYFPVVARLHNERTGYPTQKPEALLERIVLASSNPGDLVADFFCGSGTMPVVAERHGRTFIACDESFRAIHETRKRLVLSKSPFLMVQDAGAAVHSMPSKNQIRIRHHKNSLALSTRLDLDYWEVDPDWDGKIFKSVAQASRSNRGSAVAKEIEIKIGRRNSVRLVTAKGEKFQLHV